jgi:hypothetical protein
MQITNSQTLQIISNNIGNFSSLNKSPHILNSIETGANNNSMTSIRGIAGLHNQQEQLQGRQMNKFGLLDSSNLANKYLGALNIGNKNKKQHSPKKKNAQASKYDTNQGHRQQSSYKTITKNASDTTQSPLKNKQQQSLDTDPREQELLKQQQRLIANAQFIPKAIVPMQRNASAQARNEENRIKTVRDIIPSVTLSDSEDEERGSNTKSDYCHTQP